MGTKEAAQNSLYIILFSQITNVGLSLFTTDLSQISIVLLVGMIVCGIGGGICGRAINKKINENTVNKLFIALMIVIICINIYNTIKYMGILD